MKYRILLLDRDIDYGMAMEGYFRKQKEGGEYSGWEFEYIKNSEDELPEREDDPQTFVLIGEGFSERDILLKVQSKGQLINETNETAGFYGFGILTEQAERPFYRYGGVSRILNDIESKVLQKGISGKEISLNRTMVVAGAGLIGGVGNTTTLLEINESLKARGFKTAYIDLNYWGNASEYRLEEKITELSYLRFLFHRDVGDFERSFRELLKESSLDGSILIGAISEVDCWMEDFKIETREMVKELSEFGCFDFVLLDGNKHLLADGQLSGFGISGLLLMDSEKRSIGEASLINRVISHYKKTTEIDIVKIIGKAANEGVEKEADALPIDAFDESGPVFKILNWEETNRIEAKGFSEGILWGKGGRKGDLKKSERKETTGGGLIADYLIRRWMTTAK